MNSTEYMQLDKLKFGPWLPSSILNFSARFLNSSQIYVASLNEYEIFTDDHKPFLNSSAHLGFATGLILTFLNLHIQANKITWNYQKYIHVVEECILRTIFLSLHIICCIIIGPALAVALLSLNLYHNFVRLILKILYQERFAGLLEGTDAVWALEKENSLSIMNLLAIFEVTSLQENFRNNIRKVIGSRLISNENIFSKATFYRKKSILGYFYWERNSQFFINDHINWMTAYTNGDNIRNTENSLSCLIAKLVNKELPYNNAATWEILVGSLPLTAEMKSNKNIYKYPVLFRVHHSVGDGVALLNALANILADDVNAAKDYENLNIIDSIYSNKKNEIHINEINSIKQVKFYPCKIKGDIIDNKKKDVFQTFSYKKIARREIQKKFSYKHLLAQDTDNENVSKSTHKSQTHSLDDALLTLENEISLKKQFQKHRQEETLNTNTKNTEKAERIMIISLKLLNSLKKSVKDYNWAIRFLRCWEIVKQLRHFSTMIQIPAYIIKDIVMQSQDVNPIHKCSLSGDKVIAWYVDSPQIGRISLTDMIRSIKSKMPGSVHFTDIFLSALSSSLDSYFRQNIFDGSCIPSNVTAVIPVRMEPPAVAKRNGAQGKNTDVTGEERSEFLNNRFSVGKLKLPISPSEPFENKYSPFYSSEERLNKVCEQCTYLRKSPQYLIYYGLMKVIGAVVPYPLLSWVMLENIHNTLVVSNIKGPSEEVHLAGHNITNMVFWVPNRGTTGVGVTLLSYAGSLHLGIMADRAALKSNEDAKLILQHTVDEIQHLFYLKTSSV